jgi:hypothetical protein
VIRGVRNVEGERTYDKITKAFKTEIIATPAVLETVQHATDDYEQYENDGNPIENQGAHQTPEEQPCRDPGKKKRNATM